MGKMYHKRELHLLRSQPLLLLRFHRATVAAEKRNKRREGEGALKTKRLFTTNPLANFAVQLWNKMTARAAELTMAGEVAKELTESDEQRSAAEKEKSTTDENPTSSEEGTASGPDST